MSQTLPPAEMGAAYFVFGDFGGLDTDTLETNAVPWKLVAAALVMERWPGERPTQDHLHELLSGFGFIYPSRVGNWPLAAQPELALPLGIVDGDVTRALPQFTSTPRTSGARAATAASPTMRKGRPTDEVWLGLPNTSLDLDAYVDAVLSAVGAFSSNRDRLACGRGPALSRNERGGVGDDPQVRVAQAAVARRPRRPRPTVSERRPRPLERRRSAEIPARPRAG